MLLSIEKNFIFIHVPKTGGMSISSALKPWCIQPARTQWRRLLSNLPVRESPEHASFHLHCTAGWAREKLKGGLFEGAFKFAVVRNPYDLAVSYYHFLRKNPHTRRHLDAQRWDFAAYTHYLDWKNRLAPRNQMHWVADRRGDLLVDRVIRFETLSEDFASVKKDLGVEENLVLPRLNTSDHASYRDYYDTAIRSRIGRIYARDLDRFGYAF